jgi:Protein of unknown function (DUF3263)
VGLTDADRAILDFERGWWLRPGPKAAAITEELGLSPGRYYKVLNALLDDPEAVAADPLLVRRLQRRRNERRRTRAEGPNGPVRPARRQPHGTDGR